MREIKNKIFFIVTAIIVLSSCCSLIYGWFPIFSRTWIWAVLLSLCSILFYIKGLRLKYIVTLLIYGIVLLINSSMGDAKFDYTASIMEMSFYLSSTYLFYIFAQHKFASKRRKLICLFTLVLIVTFFCTVPNFIINPDLLRDIQRSIIYQEGGLFILYSKLGVESYSMGHAMPVFLPLIIFMIKRNKSSVLKLIIYYSLLVIVLALVYMSTATTSLIISIMLIIFSFTWNEKNKRKNVITIFLCICAITIIMTNKQLLNTIFDTVNIESQTYMGKIEDFQEYASTGNAGGQTANRIKLYGDSLSLFLSSPIWGSNSSTFGGHSIFFDRMAMLGLLGIIPLFMFLFYYFNFVVSKLSHVLRPYCKLSFLYLVILYFLKNMIIYDFVLITLFILPIAYLVIDEYYGVELYN